MYWESLINRESFQKWKRVIKVHSSLSRITSVGTHSVPFLNNWNGKKKFATIIKWNFTSGNQMWDAKFSRGSFFYFLTFFSIYYLRSEREWRKWAGVAIIVSSTCITLVKACLFPSIFLKRRARSRGESVIEKTLLFFLSPCYFFHFFH